MRQTNHIWNHTFVAIFYLEPGEKISRHRHDFNHTTAVIAGRTEVVVWDNAWDSNAPRVVEMTPQDVDYLLPGDCDHEVRALDPGTIVMHMSVMPIDPPGTARSGGVMMDDGTVQHEDT